VNYPLNLKASKIIKCESLFKNEHDEQNDQKNQLDDPGSHGIAVAASAKGGGEGKSDGGR
jgi:hypothetical protein